MGFYFRDIFRELCKFSMVVTLWGIPILLAWLTGNNNFLWGFVISLFETVGVFSHYEDLARIEANKFELEEDNEYE